MNQGRYTFSKFRLLYRVFVFFVYISLTNLKHQQTSHGWQTGTQSLSHTEEEHKIQQYIPVFSLYYMLLPLAKLHTLDNPCDCHVSYDCSSRRMQKWWIDASTTTGETHAPVRLDHGDTQSIP